MKSKSSSLEAQLEPSDEGAADVDETVSLPALFLPGTLKDCNDDDAGPSPHEQIQLSERLIDLGESINANLERIAKALENLPSGLNPQTKKKTAATRSVKTRKKRSTSQQKPRKSEAG